MQVFTSLLALGAAALAIGVVLGRMVRSRSRFVEEVMAAVGDAALWIGFLVAAVATVGSLYFSEVANFMPCRLCWFQRIAMYPLAVIMFVAAIRGDRGARWYVVPIAAIGACVSAYHYVIEWKPEVEFGQSCAATGPSCSDVWFREFGFVTLSFMALCGFVAIIVLNTAITGWHQSRGSGDTVERVEA